MMHYDFKKGVEEDDFTSSSRRGGKGGRGVVRSQGARLEDGGLRRFEPSPSDGHSGSHQEDDFTSSSRRGGKGGRGVVRSQGARLEDGGLRQFEPSPSDGHSGSHQQHDFEFDLLQPSLVDEAPYNFQGNASCGRRSTGKSKSSSSGAGLQPAPSPHDWIPPEELQRIDVPIPEGATYTLFFPIELTNKDYLRRIFDIVAMGIQGTVRRMIGKYRSGIGPIGSKQEPYNFTKTCDLYYLTKHITDPASAPIYARGSHFHDALLQSFSLSHASLWLFTSL
jgi:hypothetical protein